MSSINTLTTVYGAPRSDPAQVELLLKKLFPKGRIDSVLLVSPPDADAELFRFATARRGRYTNYPPYGLMVIAKNLQNAGTRVRIANLNHEILKACHQSPSEEKFDFDSTWQAFLDAAVDELKPDLIGITCMFTMTHGSFKQVCEYAATKGVPIAIGGVHVSNDVDRVLDDIPGADIAFVREGDRSIGDFIKVVNGEKGQDTLGQVIIREAENRYTFTAECQPDEKETDVIPAYDLIDLPEHSKYGTIGAFYCFKPKETKFATVLSNRGCRAQCTFCSVRNFNGKGVRQRSVSSVVDELEMLEHDYGVGHVMWLDDDLLKGEARAIAMFNEMVKRRLTLTWDATNGLIASSCTDEVVHAMAESGCIAVNIGMESGNPDILRQVRKPGTVKNYIKAAEVLRKYEKIHSSVFLMIGFPGETLGMIRDTINVAREMDLDWCRCSQLQPLPNTPIYDSMVQQGLIQDVGSRELRFMGGAYGKQTEIEQGLRMASLGFEETFSAIPLDTVPTDEQITDIWFYMNYHLNFHRLFTEDRPVKIQQQFQHLQTLCDVISPENGFALYFIAYLQHKVDGGIEPGIIDRLRARLETSPYWSDRFQAFGLSLADIENADFANKHIPRLLPGNLPQTASDHDGVVA